MPFQGMPNTGQPNPLQLALTIRQIRQQEEKAQQQAMFDRVKSVQEAEKFKLTQAKLQQEALSKQLENASKLAELAPGIASAQRNASMELTPGDLTIAGGGAESDAFTNIVAGADPSGVQRGIQAQSVLADRVGMAANARGILSGQDEASNVASVLGAADVSSREAARSRELVKQEKIETENRGEQRSVKSEKRLERRLIEQERRAEERAAAKRKLDEIRDSDLSRVTQSGIRAYRDTAAKTKPFLMAPKIAQQRAFTERYDPTNNNEVFAALQYFQKNADDGAAVRGEDVEIIMGFGASGAGTLEAYIRGLWDKDGKLPDGFAVEMGELLKRQLGDMDQVVVNAADEIQSDSDIFGWSDTATRAATPNRMAVRRARLRLGASGAPRDIDTATDEEYESTKETARRLFSVPKGKSLTAEQIAAGWRSFTLNEIGAQ